MSSGIFREFLTEKRKRGGTVSGCRKYVPIYIQRDNERVEDLETSCREETKRGKGSPSASSSLLLLLLSGGALPAPSRSCMYIHRYIGRCEAEIVAARSERTAYRIIGSCGKCTSRPLCASLRRGGTSLESTDPIDFRGRGEGRPRPEIYQLYIRLLQRRTRRERERQGCRKKRLFVVLYIYRARICWSIDALYGKGSSRELNTAPNCNCIEFRRFSGKI